MGFFEPHVGHGRGIRQADLRIKEAVFGRHRQSIAPSPQGRGVLFVGMVVRVVGVLASTKARPGKVSGRDTPGVIGQ